MLKEDPNFKSGWKFEHVWNVIKDFEKFKDGVNRTKQTSRPHGLGYVTSDSENLTNQSPNQTSPGLSSFSVNLDDDDVLSGGSPSPRLVGVKKSKLKRKMDEQTSTIVNTIKEENKLLLEQLKKTSEQRQSYVDAITRKEENKILFRDLNAIQDPNIRAYVQAEQACILQKRTGQQEYQQAPHASMPFGDYFNDLGGSGSGLPDY